MSIHPSGMLSQNTFQIELTKTAARDGSRRCPLMLSREAGPPRRTRNWSRELSDMAQGICNCTLHGP